jgi:hypothetical protein
VGFLDGRYCQEGSYGSSGDWTKPLTLIFWEGERGSGVKQAARLSCAALLNWGRGSLMNGIRGDRAGLVEANQHIIGRILEPGVGLMQLARGLGGQLTELIPVLDVGKCPKN